jgi:hypothetical protein
MTIKRTKAGHAAARTKRRLRPAAPKVVRARSSDAGEITSKPMLIGYARVSTIDQNLALQRDALTEAGVHKDFHRADVGCCYRSPGSTRRARIRAQRLPDRGLGDEVVPAGLLETGMNATNQREHIS